MARRRAVRESTVSVGLTGYVSATWVCGDGATYGKEGAIGDLVSDWVKWLGDMRPEDVDDQMCVEIECNLRAVRAALGSPLVRHAESIIRAHRGSAGSLLK